MNFKKVSLKLTIIFVATMLLNFNFSVEAKATTNDSYEKELQSIISKYGEENVIVGNGIVIENEDKINIENNFEENKGNNWVSNNAEIIKVENGIMTAIAKGTTFIVSDYQNKAYIEEVEVVESKGANFSINTASPASITNASATVNRDYYKVFVDPGHGGVDPGSSGNGIREADLNLIISNKVKQKLESKNIQVMMSRTSDVTVALGDRGAMANQYGADAFISVHQNSATPSASGIETFYQYDKTQYQPFASKIQAALIANTGANNRGAKPEDFNVIRTSNMTSALAECGFITNASDASKLKTDSYRESIANAIADSIYNYLRENINLSSAPSGMSVGYSTHIQHDGWQSEKYNGQMSGTSNESKRLEAIKIKTYNLPTGSNVMYRTHVQDYGWQAWKKNGELSGTEGEAKRLEAIEIKLDSVPSGYHIEYRTHVQDYGWQAWKKDGQIAGTTGEGKRLEAIEIKLVKDLSVLYQGHIQQDGLQAWKTDGELAGTVGQAKRIESLKIKLDGSLPINVVYRAHVQQDGWQEWKTNGALCGTEGQSKRLEAIEIKLSGAPSGYHIEYRTHVEDQGWQNWVRDGQLSGTSGKALRIEAIEMRIVRD
ncbi:N-acetylmuramoyl-L-alanine amidase [Clostridium gasigenes]|uniref:N-acetylmuramoyl-L-alanine amidase n=1 Tax=Clostridium gasigenes TaxID=94869 RepID=A0A7X0S9L4_9CLOT|nr:N-acetylmuramoyl-L-alanine amidase [Clostridium gasigenes]MBB6713530.1 N-acetylmuramoyl-L-alanine amidase [Clostridium gasigenes]